MYINSSIFLLKGVKGIISSSSLEPYVEITEISVAPSALEEVISVGRTEDGDNESLVAKHQVSESELEDHTEFSRKYSIGSFDENENETNHDYINTNANVTFAKKSEVIKRMKKKLIY